MAKKRPREVTDFDDIGNDPIPSATIRCVLTSLSPIKKGRKSKYFDGNASDGKQTCQLLSFSERQLDILKKFKGAKKTVEIRDCQVKRAMRGDRMEIVLKSSSEIAHSSKQLDTTNIDFDDGVVPEILIAALEDRCVFDVVTIRVKVHQVCQREFLDGGYIKQDVSVSDGSGVGRVTVWGDFVGTVFVGECYLFSGFMVKEFSGNKYLSMRKNGSTIEKVDDIGQVMKLDTDNITTGGQIMNATVVCVMEFLSKKVCILCNGYVEPGPGSPPIHGRCLSCEVAQRYDNCSSSLLARLIFKVDDGENVTLTANAFILRKLVGAADNDAVDELSLLSVAKLASVSLNGQDTITDFSFDLPGTEHDHPETAV